MNRTKQIKIRLSENEHSQLLANCPKPRLAEWMREFCLASTSPLPVAKSAEPPTVDPQLLRQVRAIGNNLNQIAKAANQGTLQAEVMRLLIDCEAHLAQLKQDHSKSGAGLSDAS